MELGIQSNDLEQGLNEALLPLEEAAPAPKELLPRAPQTAEPDESYKDIAFSFAFVIHLLFVMAIALSYGTVALSNVGADYWIVSANGSETADSSYDDMPAKFICGMLLVLGLSAMLAVAWVYLLARTASYVVYCLLMSVVTVSSLGGLILLSMDYLAFGIPLVIIAVVTLICALLFQDRIGFAAANLQVACSAVLDTPSTVLISLSILAVQIVYTVIWAIAVVGFATNASKVSRSFDGIDYPLDTCSSYRYSGDLVIDGQTLSCTSGGPCYACVCEDALVSMGKCFAPRFYWATLCLFLVSLFWTNTVLANIVHVTSAGATWDWWRLGGCSHDSSLLYLRRACTSSLGSICIGSLLSAAVRAVRTVCQVVLRSVKDKESNAFLGTLRAQLLRMVRDLLAYLDHIVVFFNRYAFAFIAMDQMSYMTASQAAVRLFATKGLGALVNNDLLDLVLAVLTWTIAIVCMAISYLYCKYVNLTHSYSYLLAAVALGGGLIISKIVFAPLTSAIATVYVCFVRDPKAFEVHPLRCCHCTVFYPLLCCRLRIHRSTRS